MSVDAVCCECLRYFDLQNRWDEVLQGILRAFLWEKQLCQDKSQVCQWPFSVFFKSHITYLSLCSPHALIWPLQLTGHSKPLSLSLSLSSCLVLKGCFSRNLLLFALHLNNMQTPADRKGRHSAVLFILFNKLPLQNSQQLSPSSFTIKKSMYKSAACSETSIRTCHTRVVLDRTHTRSIHKQDYFQFHTKKVVVVAVCKQNMNVLKSHKARSHYIENYVQVHHPVHNSRCILKKREEEGKSFDSHRLTKSQTHFQHSKSVLAPVSIIQWFFLLKKKSVSTGTTYSRPHFAEQAASLKGKFPFTMKLLVCTNCCHRFPHPNCHAPFKMSR